MENDTHFTDTTIPRLSDGHAIDVYRESFRVSFGQLSERQVADLSLPLRERIYNRELDWFIHPVTQIDNVRDHYDDHSLHLGVVINGSELAASARVVVASTMEQLPSGPYLQGKITIGEGRVCEVSRVLVDHRYRHSGLFGVMLNGCILGAVQSGASHLFISEAKSDRSARYLSRHGFDPLNTDFYFHDGIVKPPSLSTVYGLDLSSARAPKRWVPVEEELRGLLARVASQVQNRRYSGSPHGFDAGRSCV